MKKILRISYLLIILTISVTVNSVARAQSVGAMYDAGMNLHDAIEAAHGGLDGDFNSNTGNSLYPGTYYLSPAPAPTSTSYRPTLWEVLASYASALQPAPPPKFYLAGATEIYFVTIVDANGNPTALGVGLSVGSTVLIDNYEIIEPGSVPDDLPSEVPKPQSGNQIVIVR